MSTYATRWEHAVTISWVKQLVKGSSKECGHHKIPVVDIISLLFAF